jgi:K+-sensing histidine kinase KdpD
MEAVGRLAGGVAHDFNNLLTAIIGYAELISTRDNVDAMAQQHADLIRKAGEQAATLTRQLPRVQPQNSFSSRKSSISMSSSSTWRSCFAASSASVSTCRRCQTPSWEP